MTASPIATDSVRRDLNTCEVVHDLSLVLAQVPAEPGVYEWLVFAATAVAAIGTLGAIVVALFGPGWRAKARAPRIRIVATELAGHWTMYRDTFPRDALHLDVHNERGCDTARDVEVFVTSENEILDRGSKLIVRQQNLNFESPLKGQLGRGVTSVPSDFSRRVRFVAVGETYSFYRAYYRPPGFEGYSEPEKRAYGAALSLSQGASTTLCSCPLAPSTALSWS